ncbi:hypothetical protein KAW80_02055 [Candidatus Babeliales bacterium]|nr:hypothetical protein [Candidatus Babeliales bacterium]
MGKYFFSILFIFTTFCYGQGDLIKILDNPPFTGLWLPVPIEIEGVYVEIFISKKTDGKLIFSDVNILFPNKGCGLSMHEKKDGAFYKLEFKVSPVRIIDQELVSLGSINAFLTQWGIRTIAKFRDPVARELEITNYGFTHELIHDLKVLFVLVEEAFKRDNNIPCEDTLRRSGVVGIGSDDIVRAEKCFESFSALAVGRVQDCEDDHHRRVAIAEVPPVRDLCFAGPSS